MSLPSLSDPGLPCPDFPSLKMPQREGSGSYAIHDDDGCRTPTSQEHMIPEPMTCPPAPRKTVCRKRGRSEVVSSDAEIFKAIAVSVSIAEVEEFFRRMDGINDRERIHVVVRGDGRRKKFIALQLR